MLNQEMESYLCAHEAEALSLLKELARIPAFFGKEEKRARFCADWLRKQGAEGVCLDQAGNVIYPLEAEKEGPLAVYMAHMDTVFPDETELPLHEEAGRIYCPGVGDDTACLVCLLLAGKYAAEQLARGKALPFRTDSNGRRIGLLLVFGTGEEGLGNLRGAREICRVYGNRMESFCALDSVFGHVTDHAVGSRRYRVCVETAGGHSFSAFGADNAIEKLAGVIGRLYRIPVPSEGRTTYNVGRIEGGTAVNVIAQHAELLYEFRSDRQSGLYYMEEQFREILRAEQKKGLKIEAELLGERPCGSEPDALRQKKLVKRAVTAVKAATGKTPVCTSGSTDCNIPLSMGIPSVCMGCYEGKGAHTREEYVETASLKKGYRAAFDMIFGYGD